MVDWLANNIGISYSDDRLEAWDQGNAWLEIYVQSVGLFPAVKEEGVVDMHRHCRSSVRRSGAAVGCASVLVAPRTVVRRKVEGRIVGRFGGVGLGLGTVE